MTTELQSPLRIAAWWRRAFAVCIDGAVTFASALFLADRLGPHDVLQHGDGFIVWWIAIGALYVTALTARGSGQTLGKKIFDVRVVRPDGAHIGYARAFLRWAVTGSLWMFGLWIGGIIDSLVALLNERRRTLHDLAIDTLVIRGAL